MRVFCGESDSSIAVPTSRIDLARFGYAYALGIEPPSSEVRVIDSGHVHVPESAPIGCGDRYESTRSTRRIRSRVKDA